PAARRCCLQRLGLGGGVGDHEPAEERGDDDELGDRFVAEKPEQSREEKKLHVAIERRVEHRAAARSGAPDAGDGTVETVAESAQRERAGGAARKARADERAGYAAEGEREPGKR